MDTADPKDRPTGRQEEDLSNKSNPQNRTMDYTTDMSLCVRKLWVLDRSDTNQAVQSQKMDILDLESRVIVLSV